MSNEKMRERTAGPWAAAKQPGGLWVAHRYNPMSPGNFDRLPKVGAFRTEGAARAAIESVTNGGAA